MDKSESASMATVLRLRAELLSRSFNDFKAFDSLCVAGHAPAEYRSAGSASEVRLQEALDLLHLIEPFFERDGDTDAGVRFGRILQAHHREKGHGCDKDGLRAWLTAKANEVRVLLAEEGRELFVADGEGGGC